MMMELILTQPVKGLGKNRDKVKVKDGYARNFLIPSKLALEATPQNLEYHRQQQKKEQIRLARERQQAEELAKKISQISCTISVEAGENDRLFGAVTTQDIAAAVKEESGISLDKRWIALDEPIKHLGIFTISVRLYPEVKGQLKLWVVKRQL
jgi:large subunit ribosomal protein L9